MEVSSHSPLQASVASTEVTRDSSQSLEEAQGAADSPLGLYALASFSRGYALHGDSPVSDRGHTCCDAVVEFAETHQRDTRVLVLAETQGEREGLYGQIFVRRDHLWQRNDIQAKKWSAKVALYVPTDRVVASATHAFTSIADGKDAQQQKRDAVKAAVIAVLTSLLAEHAQLMAESRSIAAVAQAQGTAEGRAQAAALIALLNQTAMPSMQQVYQENLAQLTASVSYMHGVDQIASDMLAGLAGDVTQTLNRMLNDGKSSNEQMQNSVKGVLSAGIGASFFLDQHIQAVLIAAMVLAYHNNRVQSIDFVTMGDNRVCPMCMDAEGGNPYSLSDVPYPPLHGGCRCFLAPSS